MVKRPIGEPRGLHVCFTGSANIIRRTVPEKDMNSIIISSKPAHPERTNMGQRINYYQDAPKEFTLINKFRILEAIAEGSEGR